MWPHRQQPPGSPFPGILQARTLEWVAISSSNVWKRKVKVKSLSRVQLLATPWTAAHQTPPTMGFSRQSTGVGCHCLLRNNAATNIKVKVLVAQSGPTVACRLHCLWNSSGKNARVGCQALLQRIFPTQEPNPGLLHCRRILYLWARVYTYLFKTLLLTISIFNIYSDIKLLNHTVILLLPWQFNLLRIPLQCERPGFDPWGGKISWRSAWQPTLVFLPGESPWTEEPGGLQSMGSQRVRHDWATKHSTW